MRKWLVANWKENPGTSARARALFASIALAARGSQSEVVVCPPSLYLEDVAALYKKTHYRANHPAVHFALGAQDVFWEDRGAYTGEVGSKMLKSLGVQYVIVGHSERRKYGKESDAVINKKVTSALKDGLRVILCVGEPAAVRKQGIGAAQRFIKNQLKKDLAGVGAAASVQAARNRDKLIIAYEPIWAIGSSKNDKPEDAAAMADFIKKVAPGSRVLYGGSVNSKNIADYVQYKSIDGALVGGASLNAAEFKKIITITNGQI